MANLKEAARHFVRAALPGLEAKVSGYASGAEHMPRWEPAGPASFILRPARLSPMEACLAYETRGLQQLPAAAGFLDAIANDHRLVPLVGHSVGTTTYGMLMEGSSLMRGLLWEYGRESGTLVFEENAFSRSYRTWLSRTTANRVEVTVLSPLHPFHFEGRLELDDMEIGQLNDDEVSACLLMGAIHAPFATGGHATVSSRAAVRITMHVPRGRFDRFTAEDRQRVHDQENAALARADEVVEALRIFKSGRVAIRGHVISRGEGGQQGGPVGPARLFGAALELTEEDASSFRDFWPTYQKAKANRALGAAIRRFGYAGERSRPEDQIVDLVTSLEALLLADLDGRTELSYRTSIRGAVFIDGSGLTRQEVRRQLGRAYRVRSAVSHGATPTEGDVKSPDGKRLELPEFVEGVEDLVRLALKKAIGLVGAGRSSWPPDWDALILGA